MPTATDIRTIKNIRKQLEDAIMQVKQSLIDEGVDVNDPEFKRRIEAIRTRILENADINPELYQRIDILDDVQTQVREAKIGMFMQQKATQIEWSMIHSIPDHVITPFKQEDIHGLRYDQIIHPDRDHSGIINSLSQTINEQQLINSQIAGIKIELEETVQKLTEQLLSIPNRHGDLKEITPDDHHTEYHTLEFHKESPLMRKLERLINGEIVDDLHKHRIQGKQIVDIAGITLNDLYAYLDADPESLSAQLDGSTTVFSTNNTINAVIWVSLNGTNLIQGVDFTRTATNEITLITVTPDAGEELYIFYV